MRVIQSPLFSALVWCATASPCRAAVAEDPPETAVQTARALAYQGQEAYDTGRYAEAAEAARAAQKLVSAPTLALLEARALRKLGRFLAARTRYRIAASPLPSDASEAFHFARQAALSELLILENELPRFLIELRSPRSSAEEPHVTVDGAPFPVTSFGTWVAQDPGEHVVEASFGGRTERYVVRLIPRDSKRLLLGPPMDQANGSKVRVPLAISAFGLSALGLGAGIGFAVHAEKLRDELDTSCPDSICPQVRSGTLKDYRTARDVSTAGYVASAVGAVAGVVVLALPGPGKRETEAPALTVGAGHLRLGGHF